MPKGLLKKAISEAKNLDYEYKTRPELEFFVLDEEYQPIETTDYMDTLPLDEFAFLRRGRTDNMIDIGIGVKTIHHESCDGQQ